MKSAKIFRGLAVIFVFLFFVINGLTLGLFANAGYVNRVLGTPTSKYVKKADGEVEIPTYFQSEFSKDINNFTVDELKAKNEAAEKFIESEEEESAVLLKNDNNALPLSKDEIKKVSLFGYTTVMPYYRSHSGGGGSQRTVSFLEALDSRDFSYNKALIAAYKELKLERNFKTIAEAPVSIYTNSVKDTFSAYNTAIVTISREAGENDDLTLNYADSDRTTHTILALNKNEKDMLSLVSEYRKNGTFNKFIVLLNTSNTMEVGWLDDYGVDACLYIGGPGMSTGFYGVADLLTGDVSPSGKLVDTYSTSSLSSPAMRNFGTISTKNLIYAEGIYVGYKYYETRYEDTVLNRYGADSDIGVYASKNGKWNYADEVTYPFGYGLSYTSFTQTIKGVKDNGGTVTITVNVKNADKADGGVSGKSVVEVYAQTPYGQYETDNLVEKSAIQLVAFEKTEVLEPGESVDVEVKVDKYFMAAYDYKNIGGYYLSGGDYYLAIGSDAHDALNNVLAAKKASGMTDFNGKTVGGDASKTYTWKEKFNKDYYSVTQAGVKVENQLQKADINYWQKDSVKYLTRQDWAGTYPEKILIENNAEMNAALPDKEYKKPDDAISSNDVKSEISAGLKFADMWGVELDAVDENGDNMWDKFINQLSLDEVISLMIDQNAIAAIPSIGFLGGSNSDGIDGVNVNCYVGENLAAASWNKALLGRRGEFIGEDCLFKKVQFLWGPGANFHRTPYCGRNFEYYSEDSYIGYEMAAAQVKGTESKGVAVGVKHFFTNDQETQRGGVQSIRVFASEQTFREIYLRPFEGAFVKGRATATMTTNTGVGCQYVGQFAELTTNILHKEWGFYGIMITDAGGGYTTVADYLTSGGNMFCFCGDSAGVEKELKRAIVNGDDGYLFTVLKESAKEVLYTYAHTNLMNGLSSDFDVVKVTPWWQTATIIVNVVAGVVALGLIVCFVLFEYVLKKDKNPQKASERTEG